MHPDQTRLPMKIKLKFATLGLPVLLALNAQSSIAFAQGSLTPPGPPAATMLSLSQVEPRTPVDCTHTPPAGAFEFYINQSGSYYLTASIVGTNGKDGIGIAGNNVDLDLNGFSLIGSTNSGDGIYIYNTDTNVTIRNGNIHNWATGSGRGINCQGFNVNLEHLNVSANSIGMQCLNSVVIRDCAVNDNVHNGIEIDGSDSVVIGNECIGDNSGNASGFAAIYVSGCNNRIEDNHVTESGPLGNGIDVINSSQVTNNIIVKNSVEGGGANNYFIGTTYNDLGPIGNASTNISPWANISH
jgi:hypothetical protein